LDAIRTRQFDYEDLEEINSRYEDTAEERSFAITLCSTNAKVNAINNEELKKIASPTFEYQGSISGNFNQSTFPTDQFLWLKEGAQVMFVKNDQEGRYVNGSLGKITKLSQDDITVAIAHEDELKYINLDQEEWEIIKYELDPNDPQKFKTSISGSFKQYPIKLAWAITIHKSQGKTFDRVIIDLGSGAFDYGQTYVALSRCRTLEGIHLKKKIRPNDILVDDRIIEYYEFKKRNW
jgi:ATP-dependent exoDNAse (exonuclease V) alpha subunit